MKSNEIHKMWEYQFCSAFFLDNFFFVYSIKWKFLTFKIKDKNFAIILAFTTNTFRIEYFLLHTFFVFMEIKVVKKVCSSDLLYFITANEKRVKVTSLNF